MSIKEQDDYWFNLTQKHLRGYKEGESDTEKFKLEELKLLFLNYLSAKNLPSLDKNTHQRGFYFDSKKQRGECIFKFHTFKDFIKTVEHETENHIKESDQPFQILISGIGISGKATLRNVLTKELIDSYPELKIISQDRDYQKKFPPLWSGDINIIEDVHGLDKNLERFDGKEGLSQGYDLVVYSLSPAITYHENLLRRGIGWIKTGKIDLTETDTEEIGDTKEMIKQTAEKLEQTQKLGKDWFKEHLQNLKKLKNRGVNIIIVDPTEIFKKMYGFKGNLEPTNKSFLDELKKIFKEKK